MLEAGLEPDLVTCNALLDALARGKQFKEAQRVWLPSPRTDHAPNLACALRQAQSGQHGNRSNAFWCIILSGNQQPKKDL